MPKSGILPDGWKTTKLNEVADKCTMKNRNSVYSLVLTNSAQHGVIPQSEHFDKNIAVAENIDSYFVINDGEYVYNPRISVAAPCGPIRRNNLKKTGVISPLYTVFKLKDGKINDAYAEYYFFSSTWHKYAKSVANYGARHDRMAISDSDFFSMTIPLPPLAEQRRIAEILTTQDRLIDLKTRLIGAKKQQKKWLMQNLLTSKVRLPGFSGKWKNVRLGDVCNITVGATPSTDRSDYWDGDIPWMNSGELNLKEVYCVVGKITKVGLANTSTKLLPKECVLIGLAGQGKTRGTVAINYIELCTNQSIAAILPCKSFIPKFLYYNLDNRYDELRKLSSGDGIRGGLNIPLLKTIKFIAPSTSEQTAIAYRLSTADKEIQLLEQELEAQKKVKKWLMQQLLTGKIRVKGAENNV